MSTLTLDPATAAALLAATEPVDLVTPDGRPVGRVYPALLAAEAERALAERRARYERAKAEVSEEELDRIEAEGAPYTMEDVLKLVERP
ncbi:MAG: hypothetical protein U0871_22775 [Gemmataceae bacterium]